MLLSQSYRFATSIFLRYNSPNFTAAMLAASGPLRSQNIRHHGTAISFQTASANKDALVLTEIFEDDIFLIGINRPKKRNCVNHATAKELVAAFQQFESNTAAKAAILYGVGGTFCAGYDLSEVSEGKTSSNLSQSDWSNFRPMGPSMMKFSKPVIAAVEGYAVAGGLELALMCDLRVMDETAIMGVFCRRFGVPLIDGGTIRLQRLIGLSRALDLILTGRDVNAKEALEFGLANRVVATGTALGRAVALAREIAKFPQECMNADRRSAYYAAYDAQSHEDAFKFELENGLPVIQHESEQGASKFVSGIGRHGSFNLTRPPGPKSKI